MDEPERSMARGTMRSLRQADGRVRCAALIIVVIAVFACRAQTQAASAAGNVAADRIVREVMDSMLVPGASVAIARQGRLVYQGFYGSIDRNGTQTTAETTFQMGSITKQFTAAAILQLVDSRKMGLNDAVGEYLTEFDGFRGLRVRNLLSQTSGLREYNTIPFTANERIIYSHGRLDRRPLLRDIARNALLFAPGSRFMYSNTNYLLLGEIVERVSRESIDEYFRRHLFEPAGMRHTTVGSAKPLQPRSTGFFWIYCFPVQATDEDANWMAGAGSLVSTPSDLLSWESALVSGSIMSRSSLHQMMTASLGDYGFGLFVSHGAPQAIWHNGETNDAHSVLVRYPRYDLTVAVVGNASQFPAEFVARHLARVFEPRLPAIDDPPPEDLRREGIISFCSALLAVVSLIHAAASQKRCVLTSIAATIVIGLSFSNADDAAYSGIVLLGALVITDALKQNG
jgi:CubicO group peptidase (beta-lactamase class C family)